MKPVESTVAILAAKAVNRNVDKFWIEWAVEMLAAGFDGKYLVELAGASELFDQLEMQRVAEKAFQELQLDYADPVRAVTNYGDYLIDQYLQGEIEALKVLRILMGFCIELGYPKYLQDFYLLYHAKETLLASEVQWYWNNANRENIDGVIREYFARWRISHDSPAKRRFLTPASNQDHDASR
jgi:hypothetical protein